ncbi:LOW QUALITY PROTEIN: SLAM family member 5 [Sciurus carolinensis]|uniref:LOW QUALITY PROTEIN: SLAM family member 5 n=1 Tax=Sciurus carolinensis TaxID=30640 RepID=UPI001FB3B707|nr:LOW QUALITY PROTEIN: SLAM family member 5 [Sciurus carolinensis]
MAKRLLWILLLFLQTWLEEAGNDATLIVVNGILGEWATFPLNIQESQQLTSIAWTSKTSVAFVKPGDPGTPPMVTVTHRNYYERIKVTDQNYNLVISDLRMEDAGVYQADINTETNTTYTTTKRYHLQVYRRLGKPKITQSFMTSVNSTCNVTLTCSVEKEEKNVTYSWSPLGEVGNVLQVFQTPQDQELTYTCIAWNPVSNSSDSISTQQLCADTATAGSYTRHTGLLSGLAVLFLLVLIPSSVFLLRLCKRGQGQGSYLTPFIKNSDAVSKKTIYTYITVSRDTQPAEARIYDEIPQAKGLPSKEEPVNTIYSTVQYHDKMGKTSTQDSRPPGTSAYEIVI